MAFDVIQVHGFSNARLLIEIHQVALKVLVIDEAPDIALEVPVVDRIEAYQRAEKPPVRLDDASAKEKTACGQAHLQFIERSEQRATGFSVTCPASSTAISLRREREATS